VVKCRPLEIKVPPLEIKVPPSQKKVPPPLLPPCCPCAAPHR
jgi:hypothetical protein